MIPAPTIEPAAALGSIPEGLRVPLFQAFNSIVRNYRERRWEPSELNGGKLCEVIYTILRGYVDGDFPASPCKPGNMVTACRAMENEEAARFSRSIRVQIPRMLMALYEIRNHRGVAHTGGEVDPNHMDSVVVLQMAKWLMAELVRLFHQVDTATAASIVESLVDRTLPLVWEVGHHRRILDPGLSMKDKTLLLLYGCPGPVLEADLRDWVEYSNATVYRQQVLTKLHKEKFVEYDLQRRLVYLSPLGIRYVEENLAVEV